MTVFLILRIDFVPLNVEMTVPLNVEMTVFHQMKK